MIRRTIKGLSFEIESPSYMRLEGEACELFLLVQRTWYLRVWRPETGTVGRQYPSRDAAIEDIVQSYRNVGLL